MVEQQEVVRRLCNTREAEKQLDNWFQAQSAVDPQPKPPPLSHTEGSVANNSEQWKFAMARPSRRKRVPPKPEVHLQNCSTALQTEEERPVTSGEMLEVSKAAWSAPCKTNNTTKKMQWVIVVGDSFLRGTETPTHQLDRLS